VASWPRARRLSWPSAGPAVRGEDNEHTREHTGRGAARHGRARVGLSAVGVRGAGGFRRPPLRSIGWMRVLLAGWVLSWIARALCRDARRRRAVRAGRAGGAAAARCPRVLDRRYGRHGSIPRPRRRLQGDSADVVLSVPPNNYWQVDSPSPGSALAAISEGQDGFSSLGLPLLNGYFTIFDGEADAGRGAIRFASRAQVAIANVLGASSAQHCSQPRNSLL